MKIGIFGGRFDPIHIGHILILQDIVENFDLEKIIFLVNYKAPHKQSFAKFEDRYQMVKMSISRYKFFEISDYEKKLNLEKSYTYEVLRRFLKENFLENKEIFFIMGSDEYKKFNTWYKWEKLLELTKFIVLKRPREGLSKNTEWFKKGTFLFFKKRIIDISSSEIRRRIKEGKSIKYMVPDCVERYIYEKGLYK